MVGGLGSDPLLANERKRYVGGVPVFITLLFWRSPYWLAVVVVNPGQPVSRGREACRRGNVVRRKCRPVSRNRGWAKICRGVWEAGLADGENICLGAAVADPGYQADRAGEAKVKSHGGRLIAAERLHIRCFWCTSR